MKKQKMLLHICCAPCSSYVIEHLYNTFDITAYFYNPNIYPDEEYNHRRNEIRNFYSRFLPAKNIQLIIDNSRKGYKEYLESIDIRNHPEYANEPEKGERCYKCYLFRMEKAFKYAKQNSFDCVTTTLSISPYKSAESILDIGYFLEKKYDVQFYDEIFVNGFQRSRDISKEYGLYRQQYCGCSFSMKTAVDD